MLLLLWNSPTLLYNDPVILVRIPGFKILFNCSPTIQTADMDRLISELGSGNKLKDILILLLKLQIEAAHELSDLQILQLYILLLFFTC